jgi:hypothetical protein
MIRLTRTALLLASVLAVGVRAAAAQTITSPYEFIEPSQSLGATAGYLWIDNRLTLVDSSEVEFGPRSAPIFGIRYQLRASGPLSLDASLGVSPSERKLFAPMFVGDSTDITAEDLDVTVPSTLAVLDVGLRFHLTGARTWRNLAPFVAGMGSVVGDLQGTHDAEEEAELESTDVFHFGPTFAVGAALGTDYFPARNASLRLELQGRLWNMDVPSGFLFVPTRGRDEWNPVLGVSVGGAIHF